MYHRIRNCGSNCKKTMYLQYQNQLMLNFFVITILEQFQKYNIHCKRTVKDFTISARAKKHIFFNKKS